MPRLISRMLVVPRPGNRRRGVLVVGQTVFACALGRAGIVALKREGDGGTPRGRLKLRQAFMRKDRQPRPRCQMPLRAISRADAWCDDSQDRRYNRLIQRPPGKAEERLWREDHLYDVIVELGWNDAPVRKGRGSAIFMHHARPGLTPTAGCVALPQGAFHKLLPRLSRNCVLVIP